jgi:predicted P-loop ATPase
MTITKLYDKFHLIPVKKNKQPKVSWSQYRKTKIDIDKLKDSRVGIICGCDDLEVIDIDNHFGDAPELFQFISDNIDLSKYPVINTPSGGYHIYYKCHAGIEGNKKLARRLNDKNKYETLIETRGEGGYVVFYNNILSGDILKVPEISKEERNTILEICKAKDEEESKTEKTDKKNNSVNEYTEKPGDLFNNDPDSVQETKITLKANGWTELKEGYWRRAGKKDGVSATFQRRGVNKFYVFSTNAAPFESEESYTMFGVKAMLEFNGNYSDCAKYLAKKYNIKPQAASPKSTDKKASKNKLNKKWAALFNLIKDWNLNLRYNELTRVLEYKLKREKEWKQDIEILLSDIVYDMENNRQVGTISKSKIHEMIMTRKIVRVYNPINEFIKKLPKWNQKDNVKLLTDCINIAHDENKEFFDMMIRKHLIRTLKTAVNENYINRMVLVLHGRQEIGKTKLWQWLTPSELYFDEPINLADKDSFIALSRNLIINLDDLDQLNKKEVAKLKAYISKGNINKRLPYARTETLMTRTASFVGTTNLTDILADESNTRWIILKVESFQWQKYTKEIDPLQIWSQVAHELKQDPDAGELSLTEKRERDKRNNAQFLETSPEREILEKYFYENGEYAQHFTATDIKNIIEKHIFTQKINFYQLTRELKRLYGDPLQTTHDGRSGRFYKLDFNFAAANYSRSNYVDTDPTDSWIKEFNN